VKGSNSAGRSRSATAHFAFDANAVWSDRALISQAHSLFDGSVNWRQTSWPNSPNQAPPTFLYQLVTRGGRERLVTVRGKIRNLRTGHETVFPSVDRGRFIHRPGPLRIPAALFLRPTF
jgi:hypothetical protein